MLLSVRLPPQRCFIIRVGFGHSPAPSLAGFLQTVVNSEPKAWANASVSNDLGVGSVMVGLMESLPGAPTVEAAVGTMLSHAMPSIREPPYCIHDKRVSIAI